MLLVDDESDIHAVLRLAPQREVVVDYEIDGYCLKSELSTDKIFVSVYAALRTHQAMAELTRYRQHLEDLVAERQNS